MSAIDKSEFDLPGINWLAHVLSENVGRTEWVKMNPEEQSEFTKFTGSDYQFKVVKQPIPDSPNVIELDDGKYIAAFNTERAKNLYIQLAQLYIKMEREYYRAMKEMGSEKWIEATPGNTPCGFTNSLCSEICSAGVHSCLITSPALQFIEMNGIAKGYYKCNSGGGKEIPGTYYAVINGHSIPIKPSHWRELPPAAPENADYKEVKEEVQRIKTAAGITG